MRYLVDFELPENTLRVEANQGVVETPGSSLQVIVNGGTPLKVVVNENGEQKTFGCSINGNVIQSQFGVRVKRVLIVDGDRELYPSPVENDPVEVKSKTSRTRKSRRKEEVEVASELQESAPQDSE